MALPIALYYLTNRTTAERPPIAEGLNEVRRPDGPLIWVHVSRPEDTGVARYMAKQLGKREPDLSFLVTVDPIDTEDWPASCRLASPPPEVRTAILRFVADWSPDVAVWLGGKLRPGLIEETANAEIPLLMLDTGNAVVAAEYRSRVPGLRRSVLRRFTRIFAGDDTTAAALQRAGAAPAKILTAGVFECGIQPPPCYEAERDALAEAIAVRPVWLAAELHPDEYDAVLDAHTALLRRTHRLLLVLVPSDPADGERLAELLKRRGMIYEQRSTGAEPDAETQVYIADTDGEMGLWYRLAALTFVGHSLTNGGTGGPHPFHAAALGSVVVHGPATANHRDAYLRLGRAEASREIATAEELAQAIDTLLAPDKAAELAHAAWKVCSAGAEATEAALDMILRPLGKKPRRG